MGYNNVEELSMMDTHTTVEMLVVAQHMRHVLFQFMETILLLYQYHFLLPPPYQVERSMNRFAPNLRITPTPLIFLKKFLQLCCLIHNSFI